MSFSYPGKEEAVKVWKGVEGIRKGGTQRPEVSERAGPVLGAGVWSREVRGRVVTRSL